MPQKSTIKMLLELLLRGEGVLLVVGRDGIGDGPHGMEGFLERKMMDRSQVKNVTLIC